MSIQINGGTITDVYPKILNEVLGYGVPIESRGIPVLEIQDVNITVQDVYEPFVQQAARKLNYAYCVLEPILLTMPQTPLTVEACCFYVGKFLRKNVVNKETGLMDGWYGDRLNYLGKNQLLQIYELLKDDPDTRRAVMTIHNSREELMRNDSLDKPCTLEVQFLMRSGHLDCIVNMRANDAMLGTPQNFVMWTFMQRMLARWLGVKAGRYCQRIASLHLYNRNLEKAGEIVKTADKHGVPVEVVRVNWEWPIEDPVESLRQCALFAEMESSYRHGNKIGESELNGKLKSIFVNILKPYIDSKKSAAAERLGNPYGNVA